MNEREKNIILISASPKVNEQSVSKLFVSLANQHMLANGIHTTLVDVRQSITKKQTQTDFETMRKADAILFAFPLYIFCLPGILMRFLQDYDAFLKQQGDVSQKVKIYAVVNCGFPEPGINEEAIRVIQSFSQNIGASFRLGLLVGGGGMLLGAKDAPFMRKMMASIQDAFEKMAKDIQSTEEPKLENISVSLTFPRKLYMFIGSKGWVFSARKNGLKKKDLYRKPYRPN